MAAGLNHVSVIAHDLVESTCFHVDELGLAPLSTAEPGFPVMLVLVGVGALIGPSALGFVENPLGLLECVAPGTSVESA